MKKVKPNNDVLVIDRSYLERMCAYDRTVFEFSLNSEQERAFSK